MSCSPTPTIPDKSDSSDYGSDFTPDEEQILSELLTQAVAEHASAVDATASSAYPPVTEENALNTAAVAELTDLNSLNPAAVADIEDGLESPPGVRLPKVLGRERKPRSPWRQSNQPYRSSQTNPGSNNRNSPFVEHPNSTEGREIERERNAVREREWTRDPEAAALDPRTPVERFRHPPNKAFSVTDLVSPAWCELQYWYTLTKHGRKKRTPAMKMGSVVHKTLEDEIYTTVPVEITTKEDAWALRIWNVIQGLRMLREFGITRELEVWGLVDGEVVNGVIDQLSYECPDSELEATASSYYADTAASRAALPEYQMSLSDFLLSPAGGGRRLEDLARPEPQPQKEEVPAAVYDLPRVYMTDVKTKASRSIPTVKSTGFRPTLLQLQLYYHMLNRMITSDDVTIETLAQRYDLDLERPFSELFLLEVGGLNDEFFDTLTSQEFDLKENTSTPDDARKVSRSSPPSSSQDSTSILMAHNNLSLIWGFMKDQIRLTFLPPPTSSISPSIPSLTQPTMLEEYPTLLSPILTARYLSSAPTEDLQPQHLGSRSFLFDPTTMTSYLTDQMEWWRGERDPRGVDVMDAWKCRICEFRDGCSWRQEREWAYARRNRVNS
ncbi:uncharacterized protein PFLUO_LOCUS5904 [Penicillium psychrofluorescens]|uniref:uncharacterized protein n=1 Tax=Penicillium psychrofluorescens TaxID=3158075 RepID=UPI003CCE1527